MNEKVKKMEKLELVEELNNLIANNETLTVLIRCYIYEESLKSVLTSISTTEKLENGLFVVSAIGEVPKLFKKTLRRRLPKVKQNEIYRLARSNVEFTKRRKSAKKYGHNQDYIAFYPVQGLLFDREETETFIAQVENTAIPIKFIITTNDYSTRAEVLYPHVDKVLILDVEGEYGDVYSTVKSNLTSDGKEMPY